MTTKNIPINQIENNMGQVPGLPPNPRITNPVKLEKLVDSIKQDPEMLELRGLLVFPIGNEKYDAALNVIQRCIGLKNKEGWAILTTPKRRHKEQNFAESVCMKLTEKLEIPFYQDAISAKTRQRINPQFALHANIKESNIIIYDDILTTGATLDAVNKLLIDKNCFFVVGINN